MRTLWWHTLFGRKQVGCSSRLSVALRRARLNWPPRQWQSCPRDRTSESLRPSGVAAEPGQCHKFELRLSHLIEVNRVTQYLLRQLRCDGWYAACRHDHQLVIRLTQGSVPKYVVCYQCRPDVEKAIFHESRTWTVSLIPLHHEWNLTAEQMTTIKSALVRMQWEE